MVGDSLGQLIATLGAIDDDEIDWQNVRQTTVLIHQTFRYDYPGPITALRQRLMVVPPDYHGAPAPRHAQAARDAAATSTPSAPTTASATSCST